MKFNSNKLWIKLISSTILWLLLFILKLKTWKGIILKFSYLLSESFFEDSSIKQSYERISGIGIKTPFFNFYIGYPRIIFLLSI